MIGEVFLSWLQDFGDYVLLVVLLVAFLEACVGIGLFVSGAILLSICTLLHSQGLASLSHMLPLAFLGASIADYSGYFLGRRLGPAFHRSRFAKDRKATLAKAEALFRNYGNWAIVIGRLVPAVRSLVPLLTGISGLPPGRFMFFDLLACTIWITGLALLVTGLGGLLA